MNFINIIRTPLLRKRIIYTIFFLSIYRLGIFITVPGINRSVLKNFIESENIFSGVLGIFNLFSGGALENASIFALGIMPYITSSIIFSLLITVIPQMEQLYTDNGDKNKLNQFIRYGAVCIAVMQSIIISKYLLSVSFKETFIVYNHLHGLNFTLITILTLTAGSCFLMWMGDKITKNGIGNGISLLIVAGIITRLPSAIYNIFIGINNNTYSFSEVLVILIFIILIFSGIIFIESGQRRIPMHYSSKMIKGKMYGGKKTYLPIKVNFAGVIPPIFASTLLAFPVTITSFVDVEYFVNFKNIFLPNSWFYQLLFSIMIIFFSYFYTYTQLNPNKFAMNLQKAGGFIPGIRPGYNTTKYIYFVSNRIILWGAMYLIFICMLPILVQNISTNRIPFYFGGTGLLIVVNVSLDTINQMNTFLISNKYTKYNNLFGINKKKILL